MISSYTISIKCPLIICFVYIESCSWILPGCPGGRLERSQIGHVTWWPLLELLSWYPIMYNLPFIRRSGTHPYIRVPRSANGSQWLDIKIGYQGSNSSNVHQGDIPCKHTVWNCHKWTIDGLCWSQTWSRVSLYSHASWSKLSANCSGKNAFASKVAS